MKKFLLSLLLFAISLNAHFFFSPEVLRGNLKTYSDEEKNAIEKDLLVVRNVCFPEHPQPKERPLYLATAGSPGSRKTTILERFLKTHPEYSDCVYLDPDPRTLKYMVHTYISRSLSPLAAAETGDYRTVIKQAYDKWRGGSNYISATLLEEAFQLRYDIAHGTTLTGEVVPRLLQTIHDAGYDIALLLCSCEDEFRVNAITHRNEVQRFYQSSPEDALSKGKFFPQRMPTYLAYADKLYFYWSDDLAVPERLAATYENGTVTILDTDAWNRFAHKYEKDRAALQAEGKELPAWEALFTSIPRVIQELGDGKEAP
jgi:hypothetical protein